MKTKLILTLAALLLLYPLAPVRAADSAPPGSERKVMFQSFPPESLLIPASIAISESTPFYNDPDDSVTGKSEGILGPQEGIRVLLGERGWARGKCWWKIDTYLGPKWISPQPWTVDVPLPKHITLFTDTPLYADKDASGEPTAVLSPQEVTVTGGENQWFYTNDPEEMKWIRVQTSWLGEQWVQLPVRKIGYIQPVDRYAYYSGDTLLNDPTYIGPVASMAGPLFRWALGETFHVTGEYVNVYDSAYRVETPYGTRYVTAPGIPIVREEQKLVLSSDTPVFRSPVNWHGLAPVVHPQTLTSYERAEAFTMYHVRTSWGEVWVNPNLSEPLDVVRLNGSIQLDGRHTLYQFPYNNFQTEFVVDGPSVHPSVSWTDQSGAIWYRLDSPDGKQWIRQEPDSPSPWF